MKEFDYELDYKRLDFTDEETRKLYRIGRGEQGVLLVRPYTNDICAHWRFVNETALTNLLIKYTKCSVTTSPDRISLVWTWLRKFLEMGFTRARRYANHPSGKKYDAEGNCTPQSADHLTCEKARSATIFKKKRDLAAKDPIYIEMRKSWRASE